MSLDFYLVGQKEENWTHHCSECSEEHTAKRKETFFQTNITHNLNTMFMEAGVYEILWYGDGLLANDQINKLENAFNLMKQEPERFKKLNPSNNWGTYEVALFWLEGVINACKEYPDAHINCSR